MKKLLTLLFVITGYLVGGQTIHYAGNRNYADGINTNDEIVRLYINTVNDNDEDSVAARCMLVSGINISYTLYNLVGAKYNAQKTDSTYVFRYVANRLNLTLY